ncbi:MAG: hypothetical protein G01um1014107_373 [Parcubacteria group bacterium Gr01-1014_107]|nr:MAG: hypothetical protein G01um1014107_373 [Parcubacteria group bacterium Gr01-1014_107]
MLERNQIKLDTLRGLSAAFTNELVTLGRKPQGEVSDEEALTVIKRSIKQRKESIEIFKKGKRDDLVSQEEKELEVLNQWLPQMASSEEIREMVLKKKAELNVTDKSKSGVLIGAVVKELKGKADGSEVKKIVDEILAQ